MGLVRKIKFIQINIYKGRYFENLLDFLKKENPDFISMQEVTTGRLNLTGDERNLFEVIKQKLDYNGVFHFDTNLIDDPNSFFGNAVFSKVPIVKSNIVQLKTFGPVTLFDFNNNVGGLWKNLSRHMLDAIVDLDNFRVHVISVHARRIAPPIDDAENVRHAKIMADYLKLLGDEPFIVGGDFNMPQGSQVIKIISDVSNNLIENSGIPQTLNPDVHELGEKGYLVDFIFTSRHFRKVSIDALQVTISDHLPVVAELELLEN